MKRSLLFAPALALLVGLVACSSDTGKASRPSDVQTAKQTVCDIQARVLDVVGQVQASGLQSNADLAKQLQQLQGELDSQADSVQAQGHSAAATKVRNVADAVGRLATAVNGTDPAAVVTAVTQVADAIHRVSGCPSSSPSA